MLLAQGQTEFYETDNILVAHFTSILKIVEDGEVKTLTNFVQNFGYGDSLVVFQDKIGGNLKYYYQDTIVEFAQIIGNYIFSPNQIGKNVFAYGDNAGNYYAFYNHQFYPLFSSNTIPEFSSGLNIVAFNDYENNTFSIFRKEEIIDIESQHVLKYETGNDFVYYQDQSETNRVYYQEESMDLGYDLENLTVSDSTVTYFDGGYLNIWFDNEIYTIYNSPGTNAQIDGGIVAYSNKNGGVSAFVRGEEIEITRQRVSSFWLNGNTIVLQFSPSSYAVWWNGELFRF